MFVHRNLFKQTKKWQCLFSTVSSGGLPHVGYNSSNGTKNNTFSFDLPNAPLNLSKPVVQIFGSNTDVGKTVCSAGLIKAVLSANQRVTYVKPLQTGAETDADFISSHTSDNSSKLLTLETLFSWDAAVSPHLASQLENKTISNRQIVQKLAHTLQARKDEDLVVVETAGGVCSPGASADQLQVDVYRPFRLPVVLIGDGKLGGISATMSALDSLLLRGYDMAAIVLIEQDNLDNGAVIRSRATELNIPVISLPAIPAQKSIPLTKWYEETTSKFQSLHGIIKDFHTNRLRSLKDLGKNTANTVWWPFTQHKNHDGNITAIDSAYGNDFSVYNEQNQSLEPMFDACASWWTQGIGHGNHKMSTAIAYAASRYGHVMFPDNAHEPALKLSKHLLNGVGKGWANRVFFSDDGSTAVEVGIKMAFRKFLVDNEEKMEKSKLKQENMVVLAQEDCYHGDTLGVMNVAVSSIFNQYQHPWYSSRGVFIQPPSISCRNGKFTINLNEVNDEGKGDDNLQFSSLESFFDLERDNSSLAQIYRKHVRSLLENQPVEAPIGALLIEPVLLGAGGMILVDPLFQRILAEECRSMKIPVIFDEVFTGFWRLGVESARELVGFEPDIACYAKLLTGGVIPLAVTLASNDVFRSFYGDGKAEALLHGHSFTANPVGCAAAITAIEMYEAKCDKQHYWDSEIVRQISKSEKVSRSFNLGTVLVVELASANSGYASSEAKDIIQMLRQNGVYARALGNVVYAMASPLASSSSCKEVLLKIASQV